MSIFFLIVGLIIWAVAITFLIKHRFLKADVQAMYATETSEIGDLRAMQKNIAQEMGQDGTWREQVEVKGFVIANRPLTAELSEIPCVYCHTVIKEEYERTEYDTDDDGDTNVSEVKGTKTISDHKSQVNFYLEDDTDQILINPEGAEIDALTVVNEFESCYHERSRDYRTLGYQRTEKIIELESEVYILGEVKDIDGRLQIAASKDSKTPFMISYRSEEELIDQKQSLCRRKLFWGIGLFVLGGIIIVYALLFLLVWT
ncbi:MAG: E3 ubiquitin ligase family protein [Cyanobacteria bacterium J06600_6]